MRQAMGWRKSASRSRSSRSRSRRKEEQEQQQEQQEQEQEEEQQEQEIIDTGIQFGKTKKRKWVKKNNVTDKQSEQRNGSKHIRQTTVFQKRSHSRDSSAKWVFELLS